MIDLLDTMHRAISPSEETVDETAPVEAAVSPGHDTVSVDNRSDSYTDTGSTVNLSWGARTDVGLVREHNEDSYLVRAPVFCVCDGMGGHAAGEVASAIAVSTIAEDAPLHADDILLGAAVEKANAAVIEGAANGTGRPGMGCTATCALIEEDRMAIAHVGDSRIYLLHDGTLVRLTHDHSYVEELVDAGEITADEARVHPSRSVITRALGSDPDMYADHFTLDVSLGDRIILCSDGLSSMVEDSEIETIAVSSTTPQGAADNLVAAALTEGGHDNVTVIVVDVTNDGAVDKHRKALGRRAFFITIASLTALAVVALLSAWLIRHSWYVGVNGTTVGIYRGIKGDFLGMPLSNLEGTSSVKVSDLPEAVQKSLSEGVVVSSEDEARSTVESYRNQITAQKSAAADTQEKASGTTGAAPGTPVQAEGPDANAPSEAGGSTTSSEPAEPSGATSEPADSSPEPTEATSEQPGEQPAEGGA